MGKNTKGQKFLWLLKSALASYIVTGLLLLLLTFSVYRFEIEEYIVNMGIVATYLTSTFTVGFIVGKLTQKRKFLWGILVGVLYIGLLYGISYGLYGKMDVQETENLMPIFMCIAGGMVGGMMS